MEFENVSFRYSDDEWTDLGALTSAQYPDPSEQLQTWTRGFVRSNPTDTLSLLKDLNASGQTLILVTHSPELAERYTSRAVRLVDGRVAAAARR